MRGISQCLVVSHMDLEARISVIGKFNRLCALKNWERILKYGNMLQPRDICHFCLFV